MANSVIDSKTDKHSYVLGAEKVSTTLTLIETSPGNFGISYKSKYSGIKSGSVHGGPIAVSGDINKKVHSNPDVTVVVSNYSKSSAHISMHIKIEVDTGTIIGKVTIFDDTLGGKYGTNNLQNIVDHINKNAVAFQQ